MRVSVCISTYNLEQYVGQAVESALNQQTDFEYEILIGDDGSTDNTPRILKQLQNAHPQKIKLFLHEHNLGMNGKYNFLDLLGKAQGEYIAWLDGDDYWTDPTKLQCQVDFLQNHPNYAISFHNARIIYEDSSAPPDLMCPPDQKEDCTIEDLLNGNFIPTCSVVFRGGLLGKLPDWFYELPLGDWPIHILNAQHGRVRYINQVMASYRIHQRASWGAKPSLIRQEDELKAYQALRRHFGRKYRKQINRAITKRWMYLAQACEAAGERRKTKYYTQKYFFARLRSGPLPERYLILKVLRLSFPLLELPIRVLKTILPKRQADS